MKKARTFPVFVWLLVGLLALSAATLSLGTNDTQVSPEPNSYRPSGTKAFADLLRSEGYGVSYTQDPAPHLIDKPVLIGFIPSDENDIRSSGESQSKDSKTLASDTMHKYVQNGGKAILFNLELNFASASKEAATIETVSGPHGSLRINADPIGTSDTNSVSSESFPIASTSKEPLATLAQVGKGQVLTVQNGVMVTNRFIDKNDNASVALQWIGTLAAPHSNFLVMGASFSDASPLGILETMGKWAIAAWWQLILLFAVIVYTLGKPFGYPDESRRKILASRDFVDAVAQTYNRARATNVALAWIAEDADHEIRNKLKLSKDVAPNDRNRLIPDELARSLTNVQAAEELRPRPSDALALVKKLDAQMKAFFGERKPRARRKFTK